MITVLHGDSFVASRNHLNQLVSEHKLKENSETIKLQAKQLNLETLTQALESQSLFGNQKLVVIENLLTLPRSKQKDQMIDLVLNNQAENLLLWEKKAITSAVKKKLVKARVQEFKAPKVIYSFLDSLKPSTPKISLNFFHQAIAKDAVELIFYLLSRRIAQLIQALDDPASLKGAPWQLGKLKSQAKAFSLEQLLKLHQNLLNLDYQIKSGQTPLSLTTHLDLLLANL